MKYEMYVDGGCRGNGVEESCPAGIGIVILKDGYNVFEKFETCYFEPNTNNKAELYAAIRGLEKFLEYSKEITFEDTLTIYTDSAYTLNGITSWIYGWRARGWKTSTNSNVLNKDLWIQLDTLNKRVNQIIDTQWSKVKGHADNKYNNRVDKLANIAMDNWSRIEVDNCF